MVIKLHVTEEMWKKNRRGGYICPICKQVFVDDLHLLLKKVARHFVQKHNISGTVIQLCVNNRPVEEIDLDKVEVG